MGRNVSILKVALHQLPEIVYIKKWRKLDDFTGKRRCFIRKVLTLAVIGALILIALLMYVDTAKLVENLRIANTIFIVIAIAPTTVIYALRGWREQLIIGALITSQ